MILIGIHTKGGCSRLQKSKTNADVVFVRWLEALRRFLVTNSPQKMTVKLLNLTKEVNLRSLLKKSRMTYIVVCTLIEFDCCQSNSSKLKNFDLFAFDWSQIVFRNFLSRQARKISKFWKSFLNLQALSKESGIQMKDHLATWFLENVYFCHAVARIFTKNFPNFTKTIALFSKL